MSLNVLAADSVSRQIARYRASSDSTRSALVAQAAPTEEPAGATKIADALSAIEKFVPTEIVGIYVAVATILMSVVDKTGIAGITEMAWIWFVFCLLLTPVYYWITFATQWKRRTGTSPRLTDVPLWPVIAAAVAFIVWGLAVSQVISAPMLCRTPQPTTPQCTGWLQVVTVLVLVISPLLGAIDTLINAKKDDPTPSNAAHEKAGPPPPPPSGQRALPERAPLGTS